MNKITRKVLPKLPKFVMHPPKQTEVCPSCKGYSVVPGPCGTCFDKGITRKGILEAQIAIEEWKKAVLSAWRV